MDFGYGLTTAVERATARADELSIDEFDDSIEAFKVKMTHCKPKYIALMGKQAYMAFCRKKQIPWGAQPDDFCASKVWVLPNPSGLNRGFTLNDLVTSYKELYQAIQEGEAQLPGPGTK